MTDDNPLRPTWQQRQLIRTCCWYVVRTLFRRWKRAIERNNITGKRVQRASVQDKFGRITVPTEGGG